MISQVLYLCFLLQGLLKTNKWRTEYGVADLQNDKELIEKYSNKARVLRHRDMIGRPIIYIPAKNHSSNDRDIDDLTKFIVCCLVSTCLLFRVPFPRGSSNALSLRQP